MSLINLFSGANPQKLEAKGDALCAEGRWGQAKQAYEKALYKLENAKQPQSRQHRQLREKIRHTREALARGHFEDAQNYLDGDYIDEALETLRLAFEICPEGEFRNELATRIESLETDLDRSSAETLTTNLTETAPDILTQETSFDTATKEEHFRALCHTLPEEVDKAYQSYGPEFMDGYLALNKGDFETAIPCLEEAWEANPAPDSYIPLELATAYLNKGRLQEARDLLEQVRYHHPEALPTYQLLCEIAWEQGDIPRAEALLASLPEHLAQSRAVMHLQGETLYRAGRFEEARNFYRHYLETYGWHDGMAQELAKVHEVLNEPDKARELFGEIISSCRSCRTRVDPLIKHKYAELSFAEGHLDTNLLELYLSLAREIPINAAIYFDRDSRIYMTQGNEAEGRRFRNFANRARAEQDPTSQP